MSNRENRRRRHRRHKARTARKWVLQAGWLEARQIEERFARMHGLSPGEMHRRLRGGPDGRRGTLRFDLAWSQWSEGGPQDLERCRLTATPLDPWGWPLTGQRLVAEGGVDMRLQRAGRVDLVAYMVDNLGAEIGVALAREAWRAVPLLLGGGA